MLSDLLGRVTADDVRRRQKKDDELKHDVDQRRDVEAESQLSSARWNSHPKVSAVGTVIRFQPLLPSRASFAGKYLNTRSVVFRKPRSIATPAIAAKTDFVHELRICRAREDSPWKLLSSTTRPPRATITVCSVDSRDISRFKLVVSARESIPQVSGTAVSSIM